MDSNKYNLTMKTLKNKEGKKYYIRPKQDSIPSTLYVFSSLSLPPLLVTSSPFVSNNAVPNSPTSPSNSPLGITGTANTNLSMMPVIPDSLPVSVSVVQVDLYKYENVVPLVDLANPTYLTDLEKHVKESKPKKPAWTVEKRCRAVWLKFYGEQVGWQPPTGQNTQMSDRDADRNGQIVLMKEFLHRLTTGIQPEICHIHGIIHDLDTLQDDYWLPPIEKPHCHLLLIFPQYIRFMTILNMLEQFGYVVRQEDETLLLESTRFPDLRKKEHIAMMVYHTHETDSAKETDGKVQYPREACYTNIPSPVLEKMYWEYFNIISHNKLEKDQYDYILECGELGKKGGDWKEYWYNLPINVRTNASLESKCSREYCRGVSAFMKTREATMMTRCSIFIRGAGSTGKTTNSKLALETLGFSFHSVEGGKTGKLDDLRPSHQGLIVSDSNIGDNPFAMAQDGACLVYKRNEGNPLWRGIFLVVTYNNSLDEYIDAFYNREGDMSSSQRDALRSRFLPCYVDLNKTTGRYELYFDKTEFARSGSRGDLDKVKQKMRMLKTFMMAYNMNSANYIPQPATGSAVLNDIIDDIIGAEHTGSFQQPSYQPPQYNPPYTTYIPPYTFPNTPSGLDTTSIPRNTAPSEQAPKYICAPLPVDIDENPPF